MLSKTIEKKIKEDVEIKDMPNWKAYLLLIGGLIGLSLSAKFLVTDSAVAIAKTFNISENLIGLTLVSVGTSLPELATSLSAAMKKNSDIAIGNVVGSNIFNLLLVLGSTLVIKEVPISGQNIFDIIFLVISTVTLFVLIFLLRRFKLNKTEGTFMILSYVVYTIYLLNR
jgi:cation:H+ antiporter